MDDAIFEQFRLHLLQENEKQNLISRKTAATEAGRHIEDSRALLQWDTLSNEKVADIGSGAGFPGLVLGMSAPTAQFVLIESDLKKSNFLSETIAKFHLPNVKVVRERVEILGHHPEYREQFTRCICRAVAEIRVLAEYALPLLQIGGCMYLWKGPKYPEELAAAQKALAVLHGEVQEVFSYTLPEGETRYLVKIVKIKATPTQYPRKNGIPAKRPL